MPQTFWTEDELEQQCREMRRCIERLEHPFRNADATDWDHLFRILPDSGHGRFWKEVLAEMRQALDPNN